jgi:hypothetical protein
MLSRYEHGQQYPSLPILVKILFEADHRSWGILAACSPAEAPQGGAAGQGIHSDSIRLRKIAIH